MREPSSDTEFSGMNQHQMLPFPNFDPTSSHDDFLEQMLSSVPSAAAAAFPWADDQPPPEEVKMRQEQISSGTARVLMLQQQLLLSRGLAAGNVPPMPHADQNDAVDAPSSNSANLANDASLKALFNVFTGSLGQTSNQSQHFRHNEQSQNFGATAAPAMSQPAASGSNGGGGAAGQPKQRVRARRGQATDLTASLKEYERYTTQLKTLRRERIAERMKALQELVPNANKTDKASMLDEIIDYVKFLQLQVKVLSVSRLGGAAAVAPLVADKSPEGRSGNGTQTASSSNNNEGTTVTEQQVAKLMEEDMGAAMQYLQGKGLCLMPISLATAISTTPSRSKTTLPPSNSTLLNGEAGGPLSPSMSVLTVQSTMVGGNGGGEGSLKDGTAASKFE